MNTNTKLSDLIDRYMIEIGAVKDFGKTKRHALIRLSKTIGQEAVETLTAEVFYKWGVDRVANCSPSTLSKDMSLIAVVLQTSEDLWGYNNITTELKKATSSLKRLQLLGSGTERDRRVSDKEIELVKKQNVTNLPLNTWIDFSLSTSMRLSEVSNLLWSDLSEDGKAILIRERKHPRKKRNQKVPLLTKAREIIQKQPKVSKFIFPENAASITSAFRKATKKANIKDLHYNDLRHEAISRLFELGLDSMVVASFSGHRDINMLRRYTHIDAAQVLKMVEAS